MGSCRGNCIDYPRWCNGCRKRGCSYRDCDHGCLSLENDYCSSCADGKRKIKDIMDKIKKNAGDENELKNIENMIKDITLK